MPKSAEELRELADRDVGDGGGEDSTENAGGDRASANSWRARHRGGLLGRTPVTLRGFLLTFLACVAGLVLGSTVPLVGEFTRYLGLAVATFILGLVRSRRAYLEVGAAGALSATGVFLLGVFTGGGLLLSTNLVAEFGFPVAVTGVGVGMGVGLVLSLTGYYFGRDLRDGLSRTV